MKILFCSHNRLSRELGAPRVVLELADALRPLGWTCEVAGPEEIGVAPGQGGGYAQALREYLLKRAADFDVVDYDHQYLPFDRGEFPTRTLFAARSVLLVHFLEKLQPPELRRFHQRVKNWLTRGDRKARLHRHAWTEQARATLRQADAVNLCNDDERALLLAEGVAPEKIAVIPFGLNASEYATLAPVNVGREEPPRVCFLGTFDGRKGGADLPRIFARVARAVPGCQFRLLGTAGVIPDAEAVRSFFPGWLRDRLEVVPRFQRPELAARLTGCAAGAFPSYFEGFPFGVLEMLAAGLPVVAYRSPGPPMTLTNDLLVPPGDANAMADRLVALLGDEPTRARASAWARTRARTFTWEAAARATDEYYRRMCAQHRAAP